MTSHVPYGIANGDLAKSTFVPTVSVIGSPGASAACTKNNITLQTLLSRFAFDVPVKVSLRDQSNQKYFLPTMSVNFREQINLGPLPTSQVDEQINVAVSKAVCPTLCDALLVRDRDDVKKYLQCSDPTPWFNNTFRRAFFNCLRGSPHETFDHPVAILMIVASSDPDPVHFLQNSYNPGHPPQAMVDAQMNPNLPIFYLMIHDHSDTASGITDGGDEMHSTIQARFDGKTVYRLNINTNPDPAHVDREVDGLFLDVITTFKSDVNADTSSVVGRVNSFQSSPLPISPRVPVQQRPSMMSPSNDLNNSRRSSVMNSGKERVATAMYLSAPDVNDIMGFISTLVQNAVVPSMQTTYIELSNALATTKKGIARSFFSAARRWYGASPQGMTSGRDTLYTTGLMRSGKYSYNGIEAKLRRLADLAFMLRDYEQASSLYQVLRREYQSDKAWVYAAGAQEMAGVCQFMMEPSRYDTDTYFEIAVGSYRGKCNKALYADRALLLQLDHLMARGQYKEAVQVCVKSTGEDSDLRSGLLLEQAAHCFLNCTPAMYRKFAFHLILAGHRFGKSGHRSHALRCYFQALRVLQGKRWSLAEDHIHFTVGRQSFYVNDFPHALEAFSQLLREDKEGSPQEASYLREYLFTLNRYLLDERDSLAQQANPLPTGETPSHDQAHAGKTDLRPLLPVPTIKNERLFVILQRHAPLSTAAHSMPSTPVNGTLLGTTGDRGPMTSPSVATRTATGAVHATAVAEPLEDIRMWAAMEQTVSERYVTDSDKRRWDFPVFRPSVPVLTSHTDNTRHPIVAPYEDVCVEFAITNTLRVPLVLKDVRLSCVWTPIQDTTHPPSTGETNHQLSTGEIDQRPSTGEAEAEVEGEGYHTTPLANVHLECGETQTLLLVVTPLRMGNLVIEGLEYDINGTVRGVRKFNIRGKRMNDTKHQRMSTTYGDDHRLHLKITAPMPKLGIVCSPLPAAMCEGEVYTGTIRLINTGRAPLKELCVITSDPSLIGFDMGKRSLCESIVDPSAVTDPLHEKPPQILEEKTTPLPAQGSSPLQDVVYSNSALDKGIIDLMDDTDEFLRPQQSLIVPYFFRCEDIGDHKYSMLFGYQSAEQNKGGSREYARVTPSNQNVPEITWRFDRQQLATCITPSLRVSATTQPSPTNTDHLLLSVELENTQQGHQTVHPLHLRQVTCLSAHWRVEPIFSPQLAEDGMAIGSRETLSLFFRLVPNVTRQPSPSNVSAALPDKSTPTPQSISPHYPLLRLSDIPLSTSNNINIPTQTHPDAHAQQPQQEQVHTQTHTPGSDPGDVCAKVYDCREPAVSQFLLKAMLNASQQSELNGTAVPTSGWHGRNGGGKPSPEPFGSGRSRSPKARMRPPSASGQHMGAPSTPPPSRDSLLSSNTSVRNTAALPWRRFSTNASEETVSLVLLWSTQREMSPDTETATTAVTKTEASPSSAVRTYDSSEALATELVPMVTKNVLCQHHVCSIPVGVPAVVRPEVCNAVQATSIMKYLLTYPTHFEHDFTRQSVCEIPVQLVMKNASGHDTIHVCVNFLPPSATQGEGAELTVPVTSRFAWVNKSISTCTIPADSSVTTETVVTCVTPGVYDLTRLRLTARVRDEEVFVVQPTPGQYLVTVTPKLD